MFTTVLKVTELQNGRKQLIAPLTYITEEFVPITVPVGFITDYDSIPRIPVIFTMFKGLPPSSCTLHDYLYCQIGTTDARFTRQEADSIFLNALAKEEVSFIKRKMAYLAVRLFGQAHMWYTRERRECENEH